MSRTDIVIKTRDGHCPASLFTPSTGNGPWPGVIFYMDGLGIRPALWEMAQKLADTGYVVLLPDLFYREGGYEQMVPAEVFADQKKIDNLMRLIGTLSHDRKVSDSASFIEFLAGRPEVKGKRFGSTGYCMGGSVALTAAGEHKDAFAAVASFHAGGVVTDQPDSPHRFFKGVAARVHVVGAVEDAHFTDAQKAELEKALSDAGIEHTVETYAGARHGFAVPDHPAYNAEADARHWKTLADMFGAKLNA